MRLSGEVVSARCATHGAHRPTCCAHGANIPGGPQLPKLWITDLFLLIAVSNIARADSLMESPGFASPSDSPCPGHWRRSVSRRSARPPHNAVRMGRSIEIGVDWLRPRPVMISMRGVRCCTNGVSRETAIRVIELRMALNQQTTRCHMISTVLGSQQGYCHPESQQQATRTCALHTQP